MRTLIILRHAHAAGSSDSGRDFDRPLTELGHEEALSQGRKLQKHVAQIDQVICSSSARTRETWSGVNESFGVDSDKVSFTDTVYEASAGELMRLLDQAAEGSTILLVGHNPGVSQLASLLAGQTIGMSPGSFAVVTLGEHDAFELGCATLTAQASPD